MEILARDLKQGQLAQLNCGCQVRCSKESSDSRYFRSAQTVWFAIVQHCGREHGKPSLTRSRVRRCIFRRDEIKARHGDLGPLAVVRTDFLAVELEAAFS